MFGKPRKKTPGLGGNLSPEQLRARNERNRKKQEQRTVKAKTKDNARALREKLARYKRRQKAMNG